MHKKIIMRKAPAVLFSILICLTLLFSGMVVLAENNDAANEKEKAQNKTAKVSVQVINVWKGQGKEKIKVDLLADGKKIKDIELTAKNNWKHTFTDLEKENNGKEIKYSVKGETLDKYKSSVTGSAEKGYVVTNTNIEKININVQKKWIGTAQSGATVRLCADGNEINRADLNADSGWKYTFSQIPKYDEKDGNEIRYEIREDAINGYVSEITGNVQQGYTVTNTITGKTAVNVAKKWIGPKTKNVKVELLANGKKVKTVKLSSKNKWCYKFTDLERYSNGKEIKYTVREKRIKNYKTKITGNAKKGYIIRNTNIQKRNISVKKIWKGDPAESVMIRLYTDGKESDRAIITKNMGWSYSFKSRAMYASDGRKIVYTVSEDPLAGYTSKIEGSADKGYTVMNTKNSSAVASKTGASSGRFSSKTGKTGSASGSTAGTSKNSKSKSPKTGDETNIVSIIIVMTAAALVMAVLLRRKGKR